MGEGNNDIIVMNRSNVYWSASILFTLSDFTTVDIALLSRRCGGGTVIFRILFRGRRVTRDTERLRSKITELEPSSEFVGWFSQQNAASTSNRAPLRRFFTLSSPPFLDTLLLLLCCFKGALRLIYPYCSYG